MVIFNLLYLTNPFQEYGLSLDLKTMTDKEMSDIIKSRRYAKYTYPVVKLKKEEVDKVNSYLLNEVTESITFQTPARMIRTIRHWRRHIKENGWGPNVFPPAVMPSFMPLTFQEYLFATIANLDVCIC